MTHGLVVGRFLPYRTEHCRLIDRARARFDRVTIVVRATPDDPIPAGERLRWVRDGHPDCQAVLPADEAGLQALVDRADGTIDADLADDPAVLSDPMTHWAALPPNVRPWFVRRVALIGTESVGKTTLARALAERYETVWVPEYGRDYCEERNALTLSSGDIEAIAWGQATWETEAAPLANRVMFCDTELHTTATWSDLLLGTRPAWLTDAARSRRYDLILLLEDDVPFVQDHVRVLDQRRAEHTARLRAELDSAGREYVVLRGDYASRTEQAFAHVERLIESVRGRERESTRA